VCVVLRPFSNKVNRVNGGEGKEEYHRQNAGGWEKQWGGIDFPPLKSEKRMGRGGGRERTDSVCSAPEAL
jgi:hypothetical protein